MNILYVSTLCSNEKFKEIFINSKIKPQQQAQKFHSLLVEGMKNSVESIFILTRPPVNASTNSKARLYNNRETDNNINYHYLKIFNIPMFKHLIMFISGFISSLKWIFQNRNKKKVVICDVLNLTLSVSAFLASKIFKIETIAIVTDIPDYMQTYDKKSDFISIFYNLYSKLCNFFMYRYDSYIILTEQMNEIVNPKGNPYIVIEGMVDINMSNTSNLLCKKYKEKVIIYAGALYEKYGVKKLLEAFLKIKMDDARLWLFGSGELENEIKNYEKKDNRIKYFGVQPNNIVIEEELKATLLINPRPTDEKFTRYSFPSKNMEYMVSGTQVLTTSLQGMPKEYNEYVFLINDESIDGIKETIEQILSSSREELHLRGLRSKEFVLVEKNNVIQANKILKMIDPS